MKDIRSESQIVLRMIRHILMHPVIFMQVLLRKKKIHHLLEPLKELITFHFEAKTTAWLVIINVFIFFLVRGLLGFNIIDNLFVESYLISKGEYLIQLKIAPIIGSWFYHASMVHLLGNMIFLFILGRVVEKHLGSGKTLLVYFGAAIVSSSADILIHMFIIPIENYAAVGASGAIAGLGASALLLDPFYITYLAFGIPLPIIAVVLMQIYTDITGVLNPASNIGHVAHLGGYFSIALVMFFLGEEHKTKMSKGFLICLAAVALGLISYVLITKYFGVILPRLELKP